jgi:Rv0623-like transcription factor
MPLNIKDPAAEKFVRELAAVAGESVTTAVRRPVRDASGNGDELIALSDRSGWSTCRDLFVKPLGARPAAKPRWPYSMTSSARARIEGGTVRPSAWAVLRLTTSSKRVGCSTGRSAGLVPLRILPA